MSFKTELHEEMLEGSNYDPVIWEDVKNVTDELEKRMDAVMEENESLLNDFCDLIQILLDSGESLSPKTINAIQERFLKPKTEQ